MRFDRAQHRPVHDRQGLDRVAHALVAEATQDVSLRGQLPHDLSKDLRLEKMLRLGKGTRRHRSAADRAHFVKLRSRAKTAHAGDDRIEHAKKEQAEVFLGHQLSARIQLRRRLRLGLHQRQDHFAELFDQIPVSQVRFAKFQSLFRHSASKLDHPMSYKLQSGHSHATPRLQPRRINPAEQNW